MRNSPFFDGLSQTHLTAAGQQVPLPIFYYEGHAMLAMFPARYGALKRILPDPRFIPARMAPGVGLVGVAAFEYVDCDIGPYNELAVTIMLEDKRSMVSIPGRSLVRGLTGGQLNAFVQRLPVTTEVALRSGADFYNYPKFIADIDFTQDDRTRTCRLQHGDDHILTMTADKIDARGAKVLRVTSHLYQNRLPQSAEFEVNAVSVGQCFKIGRAKLELGSHHTISRELDSLLLSRNSIHFMYMPTFEAVLHGPDRITVPLLATIEQARLGETVA